MSAQAEMSLPMNNAHQHASNAEDYLNNGLLIPASEEHAKAAEAYLESSNRTNENSAKRTLMMLHNEHKKAGLELERRILKLREEGKDPTVPQKRDVPKASGDSRTTGYSRATSSPTPRPPMTDSHEATVDDSFMILGGQRSDPGDAFNNWWNVLQTQFDLHSQATAFASAPLGFATPPRTATPPYQRELARESSLSSDTDGDEPIVSKFTRRLGLTGKSKASTSSPLKATSAKTSSASFDDDEVFDNGDELSESFCLIPSDHEPSMGQLKTENLALKSETDNLRRRLEAAEKVLQVRKEQDIQLRDSVYQATREIAQRTLGASASLPRPPPPHVDSSATSAPPIAIPGYQTAREAQYGRRVKELEDELRNLRLENEKHKAMIVKFRDQWEKLKDSARRKKEAKAKAAAASSPVKERIAEEPELEE